MILPKWYFYRGHCSDLDFIKARMSHIPKEKQQSVADEYERLFCDNQPVAMAAGRKKANEYLHGLAKQYRQERSPDALDRHKQQMIEMSGTKKPVKQSNSSVAYKGNGTRPSHLTIKL